MPVPLAVPVVVLPVIVATELDSYSDGTGNLKCDFKLA